MKNGDLLIRKKFSDEKEHGFITEMLWSHAPFIEKFIFDGNPIKLCRRMFVLNFDKICKKFVLNNANFKKKSIDFYTNAYYTEIST